MDASQLQMCQHYLQSADNRDTSLGISSQVEWDGNNKNDFIIRFKGGELDDKKKPRYTE